MTKEEFIKICILCGYANRKNARKYAESKENLTEDDFIEVFRINERQNDVKNGVRTYNRISKASGDYLINELNRHPEPWRRDIDLNRGHRY